MEYTVEFTDEFNEWWDLLTENEQIDVAATIELLERKGPHLPFPYCSGINGSKYSNMRELKVQHAGEPYRLLYAFDPRRVAILLIGGNKTGDGRWYKRFISKADKLYGDHLNALKKDKE